MSSSCRRHVVVADVIAIVIDIAIIITNTA